MKVVFLGTSDFALPSLEKVASAPNLDLALVITQPDRKKGRGQQLTTSKLKKKALELDIPIYQPENINSPEALEKLSALGADFFIVVAYGQILAQEVLDLPKVTTVNIHPSLLPKYRGAAPIERAIMNGETKTGVALMEMDFKLDSGNIYVMKEVELSAETTAGELSLKLGDLGGNLLVENLEAIAEGDLRGVPQQDELSTYAHKISKGDGYLSFKQSAQSVVNQIRALSPKIQPKVYLDSLILHICEGVLVKGVQEDVEPGTVLEVSRDKGLLVKCKEDAILITKVKVQGKKEVSVKDFLNGYKVDVGNVLSEVEGS